jgi:hypothetical protein
MTNEVNYIALCTKKYFAIIDVLAKGSTNVYNKKCVLFPFCLLSLDGLIFLCNKSFHSPGEFTKELNKTLKKLRVEVGNMLLNEVSLKERLVYIYIYIYIYVSLCVCILSH